MKATTTKRVLGTVLAAVTMLFATSAFADDVCANRCRIRNAWGTQGYSDCTRTCQAYENVQRFGQEAKHKVQEEVSKARERVKHVMEGIHQARRR